MSETPSSGIGHHQWAASEMITHLFARTYEAEQEDGEISLFFSESGQTVTVTFTQNGVQFILSPRQTGFPPIMVPWSEILATQRQSVSESTYTVLCEVSAHPGVLHSLCTAPVLTSAGFDIRPVSDLEAVPKVFTSLRQVELFRLIYNTIAAEANLGTIDWSRLTITEHTVTRSARSSTHDATATQRQT